MGSEFLGNKNMQDLLEELMSSVEHLKVLGWKETRPWHEFFATFKPVELNHHYVTQRVTTNMLHYRSNYLFIAVLVLLIRIIFSPLLLITLLLCGGVWYYTFVVHDRPFVLGEVVVDGSKKAVGCGVLTFLLLALTGSVTSLVWSLTIVMIIVLLHALFRPRSIASRTNYAYEDAKFSWISSDGSDAGKKADDDSADPENPHSGAFNSMDAGGYYGGDSSVRKRGAPQRAEFNPATGSSKSD